MDLGCRCVRKRQEHTDTPQERQGGVGSRVQVTNASLYSWQTWWSGKRGCERAWTGLLSPSVNTQSSQFRHPLSGGRTSLDLISDSFIVSRWEHPPRRQECVVHLLTAASFPGIKGRSVQGGSLPDKCTMLSTHGSYFSKDSTLDLSHFLCSLFLTQHFSPKIETVSHNLFQCAHSPPPSLDPSTGKSSELELVTPH